MGKVAVAAGNPAAVQQDNEIPHCDALTNVQEYNYRENLASRTQMEMVIATDKSWMRVLNFKYQIGISLPKHFGTDADADESGLAYSVSGFGRPDYLALQ